jgi:hypothetical protein
MTHATSEQLLLTALHGAARGLATHEVDDLLRLLARLSVSELTEHTASTAWEATERASRRRDMRADHARDFEAFGARLAERVQRANTPDLSGRSLAAIDRQRRMRGQDE